MDKNTQLGLEKVHGLGKNKIILWDLLQVNALHPLYAQDPEPIWQAEQIWYLDRVLI